MAVDMGQGGPPAVADRVSLLTFAEEHAPLLIGLAVAVVIYLLYKHSASSSSTASTAQDLSGLTTNASGQPIVYVPTSTTFSTDNSVNNSDNNSPTNTTTTTTTGGPTLPPTGTTGTGPVRTPPPTVTPKPLPTIVLPAPRGSLKPPRAAGNGDTNWQAHTVTPGETLASISQKIGWGASTAKLVNYRNNAAILAAALIDTGNPYANLPAGLQLST